MVTTVRCQNTGIYSYKLLQSDVLHRGLQLQLLQSDVKTDGSIATFNGYCSQMSKHRDLQLQVTAVRCFTQGPTATVTAVRC